MSSDSSNQTLRISKEDMYMFMALWMQESPWAFQSTNDFNVVGSVFVLPNDRVLSADCTRKIEDLDINIQVENHYKAVHGAIRPLIKYPDKVKDCQVYLTRKPCAHCVKMLVQARVSKVFYLPLPPEIEPKGNKKKEQENKSVDALFQVSVVSKSFYIPNVLQEHINQLDKKLKNKTSPYGTNQKWLNEIKTVKKWKTILKRRQKWDKEWKDKIKDDLEWKEYGENDKTINDKMEIAFEWFYKATFAVGENKKDEERQNPDEHLSRLSQMLSNRTDVDDTVEGGVGVGCVIISGNEIVSTGWKGFPSKALYGNHPQCSVIHAEQNALLNRNQTDLTESEIYINALPCDTCMSMLYEAGIKKLVLPSSDPEQTSQGKPSGEGTSQDLEDPSQKDPEQSFEYFKHLLKENIIKVRGYPV